VTAQAGLQVGLKRPLHWRRMLEEGKLPPFEGDADAYLRALGFGFVEFELTLGLGANEETVALLRREAVACRESGLRVALHPYCDKHDNDTAAWFGPDFGSQPGVAPVLEAACTAAAASGAPVPLVIHPAQYAYGFEGGAPAGLREDLVRRSALFFAALSEKAKGTDPAVRPMAEYQLPPDRGEPLMRIGDTCAELLAVAADSGEGVCWDTGHYTLSIARHDDPEPPPEAFLRRVRHVHLHDVVDGRDHRPITRDSIRIRALVERLLATGFAGTITLEYSLDGILSGGGIRAVLHDSMRILADWGLL